MPPTPEQLSQFMHALGQHESGNDYQAIGTDQGSRYGVAQGRYQIMSEIWPAWARAAGYAGADWRDPRAQDAVAAYKMAQYYDRYDGDWSLVAAAWLGGQGTADAIVQGKGNAWRRDDGFVTVREYVDDVMANMGQAANPDASSGFDAMLDDTRVTEGMAVAQQPREASEVAAGVLNQLSRIAKENAGDEGLQDRLQETMRRVYTPFDETGVR